MGHPIHYGPGDAPLCGVDPVGAHWADEPESMVGRRLLGAGYRGPERPQRIPETLSPLRQEITAKGDVQWRRAVRRPRPHCGQRRW